MAASKAGRELEALYRQYRTDLYGYLYARTRNKTEAEDLLSETFLRALRQLPTYQGTGSTKAWLFGIARNILREHARRHRPDMDYEELLEHYLADDLPQRLDARQLLGRVQALLAQKGGRERAVVELRAQGYAYAEIAVRLNITESSARVLEHRTRLWLKTALQKEGYDV